MTSDPRIEQAARAAAEEILRIIYRDDLKGCTVLFQLNESFMKTILTIILSLVGAASAFSGQQFDVATWRAVQTYDVAALLKVEASQVGRIVAVHFNYRSEKLRHTQPSWFEASLWQRNPQEKKGFSGLRVMVAKQDQPAFKTITSDFKSLAVLTAYGRVEKVPDLNDTYVRLLGRKVTLDATGNATVDW